MPAEVNGGHAIARFARARVHTYGRDGEYYVCGDVVITSHFVFVSGHGGPVSSYELVSIAIPKEDIRLIVDHSVEACETHDKMDAEAKAQMETNAEESPED